MPRPVTLTPLDPRYPSRLRPLDDAPASLTACGGSLEALRAVALVGSRNADPSAARFAFELARALATEGVVVVSGGAEGIDASAHLGALDARGRTWTIAPTGHQHCYPAEHAELFATIGRGPGAMIWPFAPGYKARSGFLSRNRVLVALADAVVVIQAGFPSGALHAASWARRLRKPLWVVPAQPWVEGYAGSLRLLAGGARALTSIDELLGSLGLPVEQNGSGGDADDSGDVSAPGDDTRPDSVFRHESKLLSAITNVPQHVDAISAQTGQTVEVALVALLTLALENVVVEDPPGFFRHRDVSQLPNITRQSEKRYR